MEGYREVLFYEDYFEVFFKRQSGKVQQKILWTIEIVKLLKHIPELYFKHLKGTSALYEIRVKVGSNSFRIFCFFDNENVIVIGNGFQKKTQKTPVNEIQKAEQIKIQYLNEKKINNTQRIY